MEDAASALGAGSKLDRYELLCPIASGGMASVWLARLRGKRGFEKLFAIKTIKTELITDPRFQQMFLDEARLASAIQHPNVAQIIDLGEQDDTLYTVMEWVDGESLAKIYRLAIKRGTPLPLGVSLRVMANVCAGLHAAHQLRDADDNLLGVVHRDVSPENILITSAGGVKVIDFGVAKVKNRRGGDTRSGVVKGKVRYMAPEQVNGLAVDRRADLWSVGMCLYELVTGKEPFPDDNDVDVLRRLMSADPTPRMDGLSERLVPALPVFSRSLVADPDARFEDAAAMRRALLAAMDELGLASTTEEDIAEFVRTNLPDVEKKRRAQVARAVEIAEKRGVSGAKGAARDAGSFDAVAFAPTLVSDAKALGARTPAAAHDELPASGETQIPASRAGRKLREALGEPGDRSRATVLWGVAGVAIVALVVWLVWWASARSRATSEVTKGASASASAPSAAPTTPAASASAAPTSFEIIEVPVPASAPHQGATPSRPAAPSPDERRQPAADAGILAPPPSASATPSTTAAPQGGDAGAPVAPRPSATAPAEPAPPPAAPPSTPGSATDTD